jgi:hypothetical protein
MNDMPSRVIGKRKDCGDVSYNFSSYFGGCIVCAFL